MTGILVNNVIGNKITESFEFVLEECCNCGTPFFMTAQLNRQCRNDESKYFYCPKMGIPNTIVNQIRKKRLKNWNKVYLSLKRIARK